MARAARPRRRCPDDPFAPRFGPIELELDRGCEGRTPWRGNVDRPSTIPLGSSESRGRRARSLAILPGPDDFRGAVLAPGGARALDPGEETVGPSPEATGSSVGTRREISWSVTTIRRPPFGTSSSAPSTSGDVADHDRALVASDRRPSDHRPEGRSITSSVRGGPRGERTPRFRVAHGTRCRARCLDRARRQVRRRRARRGAQAAA